MIEEKEIPEWCKELFEKLDTTKEGRVRATMENIRLILETDPKVAGKIRYNEMSQMIEVSDDIPWPRDKSIRSWTDADDAGLYHFLEKDYGIYQPKKTDKIRECVAIEHTFNPIKNYLDSLPEWDGVERLDTLLVDYLGAEDNQYVREVTRKHFVAAIKRIYEPGCKYDTMLILHGPQGLGKTTLIKIMAGGEAFYTSAIRNFDIKEVGEQIQGKWLIEIEELSAFNKSEIEQIKQTLSLQDDRYRAAYAKYATNRPRRCVFFGTTNNSISIRDTTGGRRFWPIDCTKNFTKSVFNDLANERDLLWAEALARYKAGESVLLSDDAEVMAKAMQEMHRDIDPLEGMILDWADIPVPDNWNATIDGKADYTLEDRRLYWQQIRNPDAEDFNGYKNSEALKELKLIPRTFISVIEVWTELLEKDGVPSAQERKRINNILASMPGWTRVPRVRNGCHGRQYGYSKEIPIA